MSDTSTPLSTAKPVGLGRNHLLAAGIGLVAVIWFLLLSGWLGAAPGTVMMQRQNVLFNSDTNGWVERMSGDVRPKQFVIHPREVTLWRPPSRAIFYLLTAFLPPEYAAVFAVKLLVAIVAGSGVGFLAFLALRSGITIAQCVLLFTVYLLFTSNSTACLPEHFGISNGLLSIAFVAPLLTESTQIRTILLGILAVPIGGTTITNLLFPLGSFVGYRFKLMRVKLAVLAAGILGALGVTLFCYKHSSTIFRIIKYYSNWRLLRDPLKAGAYAIFALVSPAVGPVPLIARIPGWDMVSYEPPHEPVRLSYYLGIPAASSSFWDRAPLSHFLNGSHYFWLPAIGATAWLALLVMCAFKGLKDHETRAPAQLLLGWLLFNVIFHNIWGDEFFLYAPHWSWALMGLSVLGARHLSRTLTAAMAVPIVASQIYTLLSIKSALESIVR
jgi:hypothetical protein